MKFKRQKRILEIIESRPISTQEELADALRNAGFDVTQATVSRDIKELRLIKIANEKNEYRYGVAQEQSLVVNEDRLRRMIRELVISYEFSGNILVLRTFPGNANTIASLIDGAGWQEVIGTIAGDDTILLVIKTGYEQNLAPEMKRLLDKLKDLVE